MDKINCNGFTSLLHFPLPGNKVEKTKLSGLPLQVFEDFGKAIIESNLDCSKECFELLNYNLSFVDVEKFKHDWFERQKELMKNLKGLDLSDELHDLVAWHFNRLGFAEKLEMTLRYMGKDAIFTFGEKKRAEILK